MEKDNTKYFLASSYIPLESCDFNYISIISEREYKNYLYFQSKFNRFDISFYAGFETYEPVNEASENFKEISIEEFETLNKLIDLYQFEYDFLSSISNEIDNICDSKDIDFETPNTYWWALPEEEFKKSLDEFISKFKEKFGTYHESYRDNLVFIIELK